MALSEDQIAFALELFEGLGEVTHRKMFGGLGLYHNGKIFAVMMSDGHVLLKAQGGFEKRVAAEGWQPWTYETKSGATARMPYWRLPDVALDDPETATELARQALSDL